MFRPGQLVRGTVVNAAAAVASTVLNLTLTGVLAQGLTRDQFGTWAFLMVLTFNQGYFALLDGGMSVSALRNVVRLRHSGDDPSAAGVLATLRFHYMVVSVAGSFMVLLMGGMLLRVGGAQIRGTTQTIVLAAVAVRLLTDTLHSSNMVLLEAGSMFGRMRAIEISTLSTWTLLAFVVVRNDGGMGLLAVAYLANGAFQLVVSSISVHRIEPRPRQYFRWSRSIAADLWSTGKWVALQRIWAVIYAQMDRTILAVILGVTLVGDYEIPYKFQAMGVLILSVFSSAIFPVVAKLDPSRDRDQLVRLFHRATRWTVGLSIPMMLSGIFLSGALIDLWLGSSFEHLSGSVSLFLLWPVIASFHVVGSSILSGLGRTKELFVLASLSIIANLILSLALARSMGINGVILGTVIGYAVVFFPYLKVELEHFGSGLLTWIRMVALPVLPAVCVQLPLLMFVRAQWVDGWSSLAAVAFGGLSTLVGWAVFVIFEPDFRATGSLRKALSFGA